MTISKFLIIFGIIFYSACANSMIFDGEWSGSCVSNGVSRDASRTITSEGDFAITIRGQAFNIGKPTIIDSSGIDEGDEWLERTVYDWSWNESKTELNTNARWVGSYKLKNGAWSGRGSGHIKFDQHSKRLESTREFVQEFNGRSRSTSEICTFALVRK
jgi:hypothetical protein